MTSPLAYRLLVMTDSRRWLEVTVLAECTAGTAGTGTVTREGNDDGDT